MLVVFQPPFPILNCKIKTLSKKQNKMSKIITDIFNNLREEEEQLFEDKRLRECAKNTSTEMLKKYLSKRDNSNWNFKCSIAVDELIKRGER